MIEKDWTDDDWKKFDRIVPSCLLGVKAKVQSKKNYPKSKSVIYNYKFDFDGENSSLFPGKP